MHNDIDTSKLHYVFLQGLFYYALCHLLSLHSPKSFTKYSSVHAHLPASVHSTPLSSLAQSDDMLLQSAPSGFTVICNSYINIR